MTHQPSDVILVTGGTGFAGSHLIDSILSESSPIVHTTSFQDRDDYVSSHFPQVIKHQADLTQPETVAKLLQDIRPTHIYHLASFARADNSFAQASSVLTNNIGLHLNFLESLKQYAPTARVLTVSSSELYAPLEEPISETQTIQPSNPYGVSKATQDMLSYVYWKSFNLPILRVRPFNHIGERQAPGFVVPDFTRQIAQIERGQQTEIKVGNLGGVRDFTDVKDMVRAYQLIMLQGTPGEVYNVGSGKGVSIQTILDTLVSLSETEVKVEVDPSRLRPIDVPYIVANNRKMTALGWQPIIPLADTLARTLAYWREQS